MSKSLNVPNVPIVPKVPNLHNYIEYRINNRVIRYRIPHYKQSLQSIHRQLPLPLQYQQYIQYYPQQYHTKRYKATRTVSYKDRTLSLLKNKNNIDVL